MGILPAMGSSADAWLAHDIDRRTGPCVLIAVKQRAEGKTRLSEVLAAGSRLSLVRAMLHSVLQAACAVRPVAQVIALTPERDTIPADVPVLHDSGRSLNAALSRARRLLCSQGCRELLVLPADLPWVTAEEIEALIRSGHEAGFALAPDAAGSGTNALFVASALPFRFQFGPDSCRRHLSEAARLGLPATLVQRPGLGFDLDTPADLARWQALPCAVRRRA